MTLKRFFFMFTQISVVARILETQICIFKQMYAAHLYCQGSQVNYSKEEHWPEACFD